MRADAQLVGMQQGEELNRARSRVLIIEAVRKFVTGGGYSRGQLVAALSQSELNAEEIRKAQTSLSSRDGLCLTF